MDGAIPEDVDFYTEVAKRFFNEFLELKLQIEAGKLEDPRVRRREFDKKDKELEQYKNANRLLKETAQSLAQANEHLEGEMVSMEEKMADLRRQLNEALIRGELPARLAKLNRETPLDQHMSERAFREWQKILTEIPRPGH